MIKELRIIRPMCVCKVRRRMHIKTRIFTK